MPNFLAAFFQRRLIAAALQILAGWAGIQASDEAIADLGVALFTFLPAALNLLSYFTKFDFKGLEPAMLSGVIPILGAVADAAGVPIPTEVKAAATESTQVLLASILSLLSSVTKNEVQPTGLLASPNP